MKRNKPGNPKITLPVRHKAVRVQNVIPKSRPREEERHDADQDQDIGSASNSKEIGKQAFP
jgi:hypothetical protein